MKEDVKMTNEQIEEFLEVLSRIADSLETISLCLAGATAVLPHAGEGYYAIRTMPLTD